MTGIALLPAHVCGDDLAAGRLLKVLPDLLVPVNPFYLIYPSREHLAPALRSLMDFVAENVCPLPDHWCWPRGAWGSRPSRTDWRSASMRIALR